ncbi:MAG: hypothetical protein K0R50_746 [Eubacterium sp.]|nr:hypothetical protein [Eubacterium sp.]
MFKENEKIFYIDTISGTIEEGRFIEATAEGMWIRINGHSLNTFVYSDIWHERIFSDFSQAQTSLNAIRSKMKSRLLKDNFFIRDILDRLQKSEGQFYLSIINEILNEKTGSGK